MVRVVRSRSFVFVGLAVFALVPVLSAATPDEQALRDRFGPHVTLRMSTETGYVEDLYGRALDLGFRPRGDDDFARAARTFVDTYSGLFGVTSDELTGAEVTHLDLESIGTTNKVAVELKQEIRGVPVAGGSMCVLFDESGRMLALQNLTVPGASGLSLTPAFSPATAVQIAGRAFAHPVSDVLAMELAIVAGADHHAVLAYRVELRSSD